VVRGSVTRQRTAAADIREVFLRPQADYAPSAVAALLRVPEDEVRRRIGDGRIAAAERGGRPFVAWQELIGVAMAERWTPRLVAEALPARAVPRLARSAAGTIELPAYAWTVLRAAARELSAAERRELTVSDLIERAIHREYVEEIRDWAPLEERTPGIRAAALWPAGGGEDGD
jgi:hypothetical protein